MKKIFLCLAIALLSSCTGPQLRPLTDEENEVLFIKDYIPTKEYNCEFIKLIDYTIGDSQTGMYGCATHKNQAHSFITRAAKLGANLVVANFSITSNEVEYDNINNPKCKNSAKLFKCDQKSLDELVKYQ